MQKCKKNSKIGLLATEGTLKTKVYDKIFNKNYKLLPYCVSGIIIGIKNILN